MSSQVRIWRRGVGLTAMLALAVSWVSCRKEPAPAVREITLSLGTNVQFARALVTHYHASLPDVRVKEQTTYGAYVVVADLQEGRGDIGIAQADAVYLAYRRGSESDPRPHNALRGIAVLGMNAAYLLVRQDSPVHRVADLRGRRVGLLEPGTSSEVVARILLEAHHLSYNDIQPLFQRFAVSVPQLGAGTLDAIVIAASMAESSATLREIGVRAVSLDSGTVNDLQTRYPFLRPMEIPSTQLWGQADDLRTVGADALLVCRRDLGEDLVYRLTKELFTALPALASQYPDAAAIDPELAATTPVPLHPGAARYYREREILK